MAGAECLALSLGQSSVTDCTTGNMVSWSSLQATGVQQNDGTHVARCIVARFKVKSGLIV